jgi:hypothetical protein
MISPMPTTGIATVADPIEREPFRRPGVAASDPSESSVILF